MKSKVVGNQVIVERSSIGSEPWDRYSLVAVGWGPTQNKKTTNNRGKTQKKKGKSEFAPGRNKPIERGAAPSLQPTLGEKTM